MATDHALSEVMRTRERRDEEFRQSLPDGTATALTVAEAAEVLGISPHTVRYYEREALVSVDRSSSGYRTYDIAAMRRLEFLVRMRSSGMGIADLRRYVALVNAGPGTADARKAMMIAHRDRIRAQLTELETALAVTEYKIDTYGGELGSTHE